MPIDYLVAAGFIVIGSAFISAGVFIRSQYALNNLFHQRLTNLEAWTKGEN